MSSGTSIITAAAQRIQAHSVAMPITAEGISDGRDRLNSMLQMWESRNIFLGVVPLNAPGDELSEPMDAKNAIIDNLAIEMAADFGGAVVSNELRQSANRGMEFIEKQYQSVDIPNRAVSELMPMGAGNKSQRWDRVFIGKGVKLGEAT